jgi:carbamoyl-phosphate synthase large subunit
MTDQPDVARVLVTSVGSLVGRGVLDVLVGRRQRLHLVGGDADPVSPAFAECDEWVHLPASTDADFVPAVEEACRRFGVDLVIPGRDPDVLALSVANDDPASPVTGPIAPAALVTATRDKWETAHLCARLGVPFAPTVCTDEPRAAEHAAELVHEWGFPLIAKPRRGSGSLGVRVLLDHGHLDACLALADYIVQPFLDPPSAASLAIEASKGVPLFWEVPVIDTPAVMAVIEPDGGVRGPVCCAVTQRLGRVEDVRLVTDESMIEFATTAVHRFRDAGWRGPLNLPLRAGPMGWYVIEINPRFTGSTSSRLHLGFDEVGITINAWTGRTIVAPVAAPPVSRVRRILHDFPIRPA